MGIMFADDEPTATTADTGTPAVAEPTATQDAATTTTVPVETPAVPADAAAASTTPAPDPVARLQERFEQAQTYIGRQSNEMGVMRQQMQQMQQFLQQQGQQGQQNPLVQQQAELLRKLDLGEVTQSEALTRWGQYTAQVAAQYAQQQVMQQLQVQQERQEAMKFMAENPEFKQLADAGVLDDPRLKGPLGDRMDAYYKFQWLREKDKLAKQTAAQNTVLEQARQDAARLEREKIDRLAQGGEAAKKVIATPGAGMRAASEVKKPFASKLEEYEAMLAAAQKAV
jgi:hypothetical protein